MTSSARAFTELVRAAHDGKLKLPGFQRRWRWKSDKVIKLFDSLRQGYPIGSLLFLKGENNLLAPRLFEGSKKSSEETAEYLVLDGQQRLTAGIHLYFATGPKQYFLDLEKLSELIKESGVDLKIKQEAAAFASEIDETYGYLVHRQSTTDPRALLVKRKLLCTSILADPTELGVALTDYVKAFPEATDLALRLVQPFFSLSKADTIPVIEIEAATQIEAISRIFTTLNTTGQLLTPFELVVSILYPKNIDLSQEIADFREEGIYYPNMDGTGEILLQTIAMLGKADPKKAKLPKTITAELYQKHKREAFECLEVLGKFLTEQLGAGLEIESADLVPYDAIYAPMAIAAREVSKKKAAPERIKAEKKLAKWYVGAALSQRYQEGVHNKQSKDLAEFLEWLEDDERQPPWIGEVTIPRLTRVSTSGAIGKFLRSLLNRSSPQDPVTLHPVGFSSGSYKTEKHHVFPIKFLPSLPGWGKGDTGDVILNLMLVEGETNKRWINNSPAEHLAEATRTNGVDKTAEVYARQAIDGTALKLLGKPVKSKSDFYDFLALREARIQNLIESEYKFPKGGAIAEEESDNGD